MLTKSIWGENSRAPKGISDFMIRACFVPLSIETARSKSRDGRKKTKELWILSFEIDKNK